MSRAGWRGVADRAWRRLRRRTASAGPGVGHPASAARPSAIDLPQQGLRIGPALDAIVARWQGNRQEPGVDADYDLVQQNFDYAHYALQATFQREHPEVDPVREFVQRGARSRNSPHVHFSMANYLRRYPDKRTGPERTPYLEWIKRGRDAGEIADPAYGVEQLADVLGLAPQAVVDELTEMRTDMTVRLRTGTLGEMFAKAAEIEPLVGAAWAETAEIRVAPFAHDGVAGAVAGVYACQRAAGFRRARLVVVTDRPRADSGRRFAEQIVAAGALEPDDVVVVYTDGSDGDGSTTTTPGIREVDFHRHAAGPLDEYAHQGLVSLLRSFMADAIVVADSALLYRAMLVYGRALTASERVYPYFVSRRRRALGNWVGWDLKWMYAGLHLVAGTLTDSAAMKDELVERYQLAPRQAASIEVLPAPVDASIEPWERDAGPARRPVVGWAGRGEWPRWPELAFEVARRLPEVDFHLWAPVPSTEAWEPHRPANVELVGEPFDVRCPGRRVDAWLYTSGSDGVPGLLLDVAMTGTPIVASLVGGIGEILSAEDAWPVTDIEDAGAYVDALTAVLADPAAASERAARLRKRLVHERTPVAYASLVAPIVRRNPVGEGFR